MQPSSQRSTRELASRLRFKHLQLLLELERGGSLRAAADAVHLTQPALSKALNEIEDAFGCRLFVRTARGLQPTGLGRAALRGAHQLLENLAHVQRELALGEGATILRVGAPPFVAHGYLPEVIARLRRGPRPVHVELLEERVPILLRALAAGEVDALVSSHPAQMPEDLGVVLRFERLFEARFIVIAPPKHPLVKAARVDWRMLAQHAWVISGKTSLVRRVVEEGFVRAGVSPPVPVVESSSPVTNVQLVAAGIGWSVVPEPVAKQALATGTVHAVRVRPSLAPGPVALIHREHAGGERVALLRDALRTLA